VGTPNITVRSANNHENFAQMLSLALRTSSQFTGLLESEVDRPTRIGTTLACSKRGLLRGVTIRAKQREGGFSVIAAQPRAPLQHRGSSHPSLHNRDTRCLMLDTSISSGLFLAWASLACQLCSCVRIWRLRAGLHATFIRVSPTRSSLHGGLNGRLGKPVSARSVEIRWQWRGDGV
jgi:hypothetical protein